MFNEIRQLSATALAEKYRNKELSPVEVTKCNLAALETLNEKLNMVYLSRPEPAMIAAKASEQRWLAGRPNSLLDGITTTIKDGLLSINEPSYRGSIANDTAQQQWLVDAPVVARMKAAGMISLGKTTMPDFGILASGYSSKHGITRNPWDLTKNTGGSSAGAAASIACGLSPLTVGTDIVGSIRLPASFCGLFGLKPSQGRVPYYPPNSPSLVAGPMSRDVTDAALLMNHLSITDQRDFTALAAQSTDYLATLEQAPRQVKLGLLTDIGFGPEVDHEVTTAVIQAAQSFVNQGYGVDAIDSPFTDNDDACAELFYRMRCYAEFSAYSEDLKTKSPYINRWTQGADKVSAKSLVLAQQKMHLMRQQVMQMFDHIDYLLLPSVATPAFDAELPAADTSALFAPWSNTYLFNNTEQPACSINCGYTSQGLPIGLQIVGRRFDDMGVLQMARLYEKIRPKQRQFPELI